jgi:hypothetical protein
MSIKYVWLLSMSLLLLGGAAVPPLMLAWNWDHALGTPAWNLLLVRVTSQEIAQNTVALTALAPAACQALIEQGHHGGYDPRQTWCAPLACPGAGAYSILLQAEDSLPSNVVTFGIDTQCRVIAYEAALALALPGSQPGASPPPATAPLHTRPVPGQAPSVASARPPTPDTRPSAPPPATEVPPTASGPEGQPAPETDVAAVLTQAEAVMESPSMAPVVASEESPPADPLSLPPPNASPDTPRLPEETASSERPPADGSLAELQARFAEIEQAYALAQDQITEGYETLRRQYQASQQRRRPRAQQHWATMWAEYQQASTALLQAYREALTAWQHLMQRWQTLHALPEGGLPLGPPLALPRLPGQEVPTQAGALRAPPPNPSAPLGQSSAVPGRH